jgi:hypothetical protein
MPFDEHDLVNLILSMCPTEWEMQWKLSQKTVPWSVSELMEVLETIRKLIMPGGPRRIQGLI